MKYKFQLVVKIDTIAEKQRCIIVNQEVKSLLHAFVFSVKYLIRNRVHNVKYIGFNIISL